MTRKNHRIRNKNGILLQLSSWRDACGYSRLRLVTPPLGAASSERHGDGDDDDTGSDISLLPLNDKGIYSERLFLNLSRPHGGVPVTA